jgi:hypothetical protein
MRSRAHTKAKATSRATDGGEIEGGTWGRHPGGMRMDGICLRVGHHRGSHYYQSNFGSDLCECLQLMRVGKFEALELPKKNRISRLTRSSDNSRSSY